MTRNEFTQQLALQFMVGDDHDVALCQTLMGTPPPRGRIEYIQWANEGAGRLAHLRATACAKGFYAADDDLGAFA